MIPSGQVYVFKRAALTVKMATLLISSLAKFYCNRSITILENIQCSNSHLEQKHRQNCLVYGRAVVWNLSVQRL